MGCLVSLDIITTYSLAIESVYKNITVTMVGHNACIISELQRCHVTIFISSIQNICECLQSILCIYAIYYLLIQMLAKSLA